MSVFSLNEINVLNVLKMFTLRVHFNFGKEVTQYHPMSKMNEDTSSCFKSPLPFGSYSVAAFKVVFVRKFMKEDLQNFSESDKDDGVSVFEVRKNVWRRIIGKVSLTVMRYFT